MIVEGFYWYWTVNVWSVGIFYSNTYVLFLINLFRNLKKNNDVKIVDNGPTNSNFDHFDDSKEYTGWSTLRIFVCLVDGNFQISCLQCPFCLLFSLWSKQCARGSCCLLLLLFSSLCCLLSSRQSLNATLHRAKWGEISSEDAFFFYTFLYWSDFQ